MKFILDFFKWLFGPKTQPSPTPTPSEPTPSEPPIADPPITDPTPLITYPLKADQVDGVNLTQGTNYTLTAEDMFENEAVIDLEKVAERNGMHESSLSAFNEHRALTVGNQCYVPSVDELCFYEYCLKYKELEMAKANYLTMPETPNKKLLKAARYRGAGELGKFYGTSSLVFRSPNGQLDGASERRTELINGNKEFKVNWGPDLWKCNIFMHDCVFFSGYQPDMLSNDHYITAGSLQVSSRYKQLTVEEVTPGCVVQLFNGSGSNASHNMVLMSFVERIGIDGGSEVWTFKAMGAESDRVAVSIRRHYLKPEAVDDFYHVDTELDHSTRTFIRFFKPLFKRDLV